MNIVDLTTEVERQLIEKTSRFPGGCVVVVLAREDKDEPLYLYLALAQQGALHFAVGCRYSIALTEKAGLQIITDTAAKNLQFELFRKITGL